ncbi:MAG: DUF1318 domain-containing protein [Deltaproteobacteria bacterium]|nr:DUF1318 domain-containing protein [Deltaproteobacteria bacterium]MBW2042350.1 DUF1318 domain-containing protein [Deltaproteobacteria bacterium]
MKLRYLWIVPAVLFLGCTLAQVNVEVLSERTAMENQILGTYNALDDEMLLLASVRAVDASGAFQATPPKSREQQEAVTALQVLAFHADDLAAFKRLGWVGENNQGLLTPFPMEKKDVPEDLKDLAGRYQKEEFEFVVSEINNARERVMRRVIELNDNLTDADWPSVRSIFGKLNAENALPGEKVQNEDGTWRIRS